MAWLSWIFSKPLSVSRLSICRPSEIRLFSSSYSPSTGVYSMGKLLQNSRTDLKESLSKPHSPVCQFT